MTGWAKVRTLYQNEVEAVKMDREFIALLERLLEELYDSHIQLNTNIRSSPQLVPSGADLWAEWEGNPAVLSLRRAAPSPAPRRSLCW